MDKNSNTEDILNGFHNPLERSIQDKFIFIS